MCNSLFNFNLCSNVCSDVGKISSIEFSLNYTKLAIKAYVEKSKIHSAKKVTSSGD